MAVEFGHGVSRRLQSDHYGWLTTVAASGQPVPRLVGFYFDGVDVFIYSRPGAAKVRHIENHSRVSLNLESDGAGGGVVVVGGVASIDATRADPRDDESYWAKYRSDVEQSGMTESIADFSTRLRIAIDTIWT